MPLSAFVLILLAGFIHASWNIAAKKANGDARFALQSGVFLMLVWAPVGLWLGWPVVPTWGLVLVLYAVQQAPISHVAPAREVSMLFAALLGGHLLREGDRLPRLVGAVFIAAGVIALAIG